MAEWLARLTSSECSGFVSRSSRVSIRPAQSILSEINCSKVMSLGGDVTPGVPSDERVIPWAVHVKDLLATDS